MSDEELRRLERDPDHAELAKHVRCRAEGHYWVVDSCTMGVEGSPLRSRAMHENCSTCGASRVRHGPWDDGDWYGNNSAWAFNHGRQSVFLDEARILRVGPRAIAIGRQAGLSSAARNALEAMGCTHFE